MGELAEKVIPMDQGAMVLSTLQDALDKGVGADNLEKILNMQERILDRQAAQAYSQAMVSVQSKMPVIKQNRTNDQTRSTYADMGQILKQITPVYTEAGFALSFGEGVPTNPGEVRVACEVMHSQGHSKSYFTDIPLDIEGIKGNRNKTNVHGTASAISYGQRYLTKLIFNLNTGDDDDGNSAGGDERSALEVDNEWIERMIKMRVLIPSIHCIKEVIQNHLADPEKYGLEKGVEAWFELTHEQCGTIWYPAPTKGGILTTKEREVIKSDEWSSIRKGME